MPSAPPTAASTSTISKLLWRRKDPPPSFINDSPETIRRGLGASKVVLLGMREGWVAGQVRHGVGQSKQVSVEVEVGAGHDRIGLQGPGLPVDIRQGGARFGGQKAARSGVDGGRKEQDVGRDSTGGNVGE